VHGLCCGYEDLNEHQAPRGDVLMQTAVGREQTLASAPTLSRLDNRATHAQAWALPEVLAAQFIASHEHAPDELALDIDATSLHGQQELVAYHAYYDAHCYLQLYVFCGQAMLACYLLPRRRSGTRHAAAVIKLLVGRLRRSGRTRGSSCAPTRASAAGACCNGASARAWATRSAWRATRGCTRPCSTSARTVRQALRHHESTSMP
jgi:hypothetical protein